MGITSKYIDRHPTAFMTNNPPWDRYPGCHPEVLSCKQQIIAISKVPNVSNVTTQGNYTVVYSLVATTQTWHERFSQSHSTQKRHEPTI